MKILRFLIFSFVVIYISSCGVYKDPYLQTQTQKLDPDELNFIAQFEDAVVKHNRNKLTKFLEENYRDEELNGLYGGDKRRFWNEMFCGKEINNPDKFTCIKLRNIREIHLIKVEPGYNENEKILYFKVIGYDHTIITDLTLTYKVDYQGNKVFGIVGAYG